MTLRRIAVALVALLLLMGWSITTGYAIAGAQEGEAPTETAVTTTTLPSAAGVGSILGPRPGEGQEPEDAGDRGGAAQVATFWIVFGALGVIGLLIVRDVKKGKASRIKRGAEPSPTGR